MKPIIIAIDGRCASGKTTLAKAISEQIDCNVIHMDDFFLRPEQRTANRLATPGENIDHERFLEEVLIPLSKGFPVTYHPFDCHKMGFGEEILLSPKKINIVEGSYSYHPSLRDYYAYTFFLTISLEEQMKRIIDREGVEKAKIFKEKWIPLEEEYFKTLKVTEWIKLG